MGVITIAASFAMISGRKISLIGGLKWNCQDKIRISFFVRSVTMHPLRKAENSKSVSCFFVSVREIHECSLNFESLSKQDFLHPS